MNIWIISVLYGYGIVGIIIFFASKAIVIRNAQCITYQIFRFFAKREIICPQPEGGLWIDKLQVHCDMPYHSILDILKNYKTE